MQCQSDNEHFTVASSAEQLRQAARAGDEPLAKSIISRYKQENSALNKLLPAVMSATDKQSGNSALHLCCANGHAEIVQLLLNENASIDQVNTWGSTALHYASLTGQEQVVQLLLKHGAKAVVENKYGKTALDEAHNGRHSDVAKLLIQHVETSAATAPNLDQQDA
ncbi:Ankyrin-2 [Gracilariopsis chorda]|uniref:Ankyrin-2 n=1 Tax=Gracilariopsis chorda TaxID=448386 RepID=A0A2V3IHR7_9FLOR|nr:Ankyrin-2 [Gracilariopsis chorda]|eukprot:PXF41636.1 Ankyrin-2 [Gracilariopsis chorda]